MFGLVHACSASLGPELLAQWRSHLCGVCLTLRDAHGQSYRALTSTDAVMLAVLVEAQLDAPTPRVQAGRCPLRGMRTEQVIPPEALSVRLGAAATLTLATAKAADVRAEHATGLGASAWAARTAAAVSRPLARAARSDPVLPIGAVLDDLAGQAGVEQTVERGDSLDVVTEPTAQATARVFGAAADLAGRPENREPLEAIGAAFGRLAHLLDAVEDLERDARRGAFNPILVTGVPLPQVRRECARQVRRIRTHADRLHLIDPRLARALLVEGTHAALHRAFDGSTPADRPPWDAPPNEPPSTYPGYPPPPAYPPSDAPPGGYPGYPPAGPPPSAPPPPRPPFWPAVLPWVGVYCTGYACCADHTNPCTGQPHPASVCTNCGDCSGCDCGDGCCCDCDCCGCDC